MYAYNVSGGVEKSEIINYIYLHIECKGGRTFDLSNENAMRLSKWEFDITQSNEGYDGSCKLGDTWYGFSYPGSGSVEIKLEGSGVVALNVGNCFKRGVVKVFLNEMQVGLANAEVKFKDIDEFQFSDGDVLKIVEEDAIIKLNAMEIKCPRTTSKHHGIIK